MKYSNLESQRTDMRTVELPEGTVIDPSARIYGIEYMKIGRGVYIGPNVYMRGHITMGDRVWIGPNADISGEGGLVIEDDVGIGNSAVILTSQHDIHKNPTAPIATQPLKYLPVKLCRGCNIGVNATILPGVLIGPGAQVGAGAVVTRNVAKGIIVAGNPARVIGER